ncbi:putative alpha,alpha-trehalose-phosphate synthase [UDP-forming] 11 [Turnera subulata]|uniref:Alpha,alpha-trehalose-phosphate synthase [UDP-forming] 11 n=1 Tax=Turnera subulata TaxID=218843 RepID=A0A9Q0J326_9ROSI|nr:putative alpha,alpha-trehalose-phosphate synthase [UDP-forming] 11 [Turnera subulata]
MLTEPLRIDESFNCISYDDYALLLAPAFNNYAGANAVSSSALQANNNHDDDTPPAGDVEDDHETRHNVVDGAASGDDNSQRRIIVANHLPVHAYREGKEWRFELDEDSIYLQLKDGLPSSAVWYVGCLRAEVDVKDQDKVSKVLGDKFHCLPVFLSPEEQEKYYHGFCKHYLWPLFHYMLPLTPSHGARFDRSQWRAYLSANKKFSAKVVEAIDNPDEDSVWVHDYHLMLLPTFLRKRYYRIRIGFFLHSPFPSSEIFRTIPVREEILRSLLNCDLVGFHTFDYARHFLSCCSRMLGLDYESKRGHLGIDYYGRTVSIKILPVGMHMGQLESLLQAKETAAIVKKLREKYEGKIVIVGVDDLDLFKGIGLKFLAIGRLLEQNEWMRGRVVLVQIANPARSQGKDVQDVRDETNAIAAEINHKYGREGYEPIVYINGPVSTQEKAAYYAISECCVVTAVRDGMNLVAYKYTVCRQGSPVLDAALGIDGMSKRKESVLILSEFIGCSPSLSGAIRVNPWNIDAVADAIYDGIHLKDQEKQLRHEKHYRYISSHDVAYWARSFDQDLQRASSGNHSKRYWGVGFGLEFRIVALGPNFMKLQSKAIFDPYKAAKNRLILLDYDGTMMPQTSVDKAPSSQIISVLNCLCSDPKNTVFIVSGRGKDSLGQWFSPCAKLGLSAEHGYLTRWTMDSPWETNSVAIDSKWRKIAEPVMRLYTESTDGSFIEYKESALVWHHQEADFQLSSCQAKELLDHLENVLANEPVVVKRGQYIVEVKPQGISKGMVVQNLISAMTGKGMPPDFLLCLGDDRSDEDMFESIESHVKSLPHMQHVFACTVGQKPSMAKYYLDDTSDVLDLLETLSTGEIAVKERDVQAEVH